LQAKRQSGGAAASQRKRRLRDLIGRARDGGGQFLIADSSGLPELLLQLEAGLVDRYVIHYSSREAPGRRIEVQVQIDGMPGSAALEYLAPSPARAIAKPVKSRSFWVSTTALVVISIGVALLLGAAFGSVRRVVLVLSTLPFALVGGVAVVYASGGVLDVGALIGGVTLLGITTRNGIMMVSHWQHLHEVEGMLWGPELVFRGARERLAPVLMTALVTGLGLLPLALGAGEAGREIEGPMALVILGGLVTSTVLNLGLMPALYLAFGRAGGKPEYRFHLDGYQDQTLTADLASDLTLKASLEKTPSAAPPWPAPRRSARAVSTRPRSAS